MDTLACCLRRSIDFGRCVEQVHLYSEAKMAPLTPDKVVLVPWRHRKSIERAVGRQSSSERLPLKGKCPIEYVWCEVSSGMMVT